MRVTNRRRDTRVRRRLHQNLEIDEAVYLFFFQAEDGIRYLTVTGVQTCALPIYYRHAVLLTLGTGVGGALLAEGRLFKGHIGRAGHVGHISLNPDGPPDIVGTPGSLEQTIGNSTLPVRSRGRFSSTRQLVEAHLKGDAEATDVWLRSLYNLAAGITSIINALDPEVIILGGGIALAGPALFEPLARFVERVEWRPQGQSVRIIPAALGDLA